MKLWYTWSTKYWCFLHIVSVAWFTVCQTSWTSLYFYLTGKIFSSFPFINFSIFLPEIFPDSGSLAYYATTGQQSYRPLDMCVVELSFSVVAVVRTNSKTTWRLNFLVLFAPFPFFWLLWSVANGAMETKLKESEDHYTYVNVDQFDYDTELTFWKPRGSVGDRLVLVYAWNQLFHSRNDCKWALHQNL